MTLLFRGLEIRYQVDAYGCVVPQRARVVDPHVFEMEVMQRCVVDAGWPVGTNANVVAAFHGRYTVPHALHCWSLELLDAVRAHFEAR